MRAGDLILGPGYNITGARHHVAGGFSTIDTGEGLEVTDLRADHPGIMPANRPDFMNQSLVSRRPVAAPVRTCRVCGCTDRNCRQCIEKTGEPCYWVDRDLCSACVQ